LGDRVFGGEWAIMFLESEWAIAFWVGDWAIVFKGKTCKYPYGAKILQKLLHFPKLLSLSCNHLGERDKNYHIPASFLDY
jgi:hypothetical protein